MAKRPDSIISELTSMAGNYRTARSGPQEFNDAVRDYNQAVEAYNYQASSGRQQHRHPIQ